MSKEIETRINRLIGKLNTVDELARVIVQARDRKSLIHNRDRQSELDLIWDAVKDWRPGEIVRAGKAWRISSFADGAGAQDLVGERDEFVVWWTQPKARRVWLISVNGWADGITYGAELSAHVDRLASAYQRRQLDDPTLRAAWDHARKSSMGFELRDLQRCEFRKIEIHESFGSADVDQTTEQA